MRRIAFLLAALAAAPAGCSSLIPKSNPDATTGWTFTIGAPSTLTLPATTLVQQSSGNVAALPFGAALGPAGGQPTLAQLAASPGPCGPAPAPLGPTLAMPRLAAQAPPCTLEDVCAKLDLVERRISTLETGRAMPKGAP